MKFNINIAVLYGSFTIMITDFSKISHMSLGPLWYVSVLFWVCLFYFALLKYFGKDNKDRVNFVIGLITVLSYYICIRINKGGFTAPEYSNGIFSVGFLRGFAGIGAGYILGVWYSLQTEKIVLLKEKIGWTIFEAVCLYLVINSLFINCMNHIYDFNIILYQLFLIFCFMNNKGYISQFLNKSYWDYFSRYCYSIYVVHTLTWVITVKLIPFLSSNTEIILVVFGIPLLLGVLIYHMVEQPCAKYLKNKWFKS